MQNNQIDRTINALIILWALSAGYFAFADLQTSVAIVNENSAWAKFIQNFGEVPGLLVLLLGTFAYASSVKYDSASKKYVLLPFLFLASVYLLYHSAVVLSNGLRGNYAFIIRYRFLFAVAVFFLNLIVYYFLVNRRLKLDSNFNLFGKVTVALGISGYLLYVQPLKIIWGRVRFRDLDALYSNFTQWYVINGPNGNTSFPSGHAAMAWMVLPLILLAVNKSKYLKMFLLAMIISWGIAVSAGRVAIGAHFMSDVIFSSMWIIICFLLLLKTFSNEQTALQE